MVDIELNPLNVLGKRKLNFIPNHFHKVWLKDIDSSLLTSWVYKNLVDQFAISYTTSVESSVKTTYVVLGFENPKELTFTLLKCPYIEKRRT